ncbi:hypothetical protein A2U01_0002804, partial [Trifolium medium]|nr:hypothetical protein [Trifolium medium]
MKEENPIYNKYLVKILLLDFGGGSIFRIGDDCTFTSCDRSVLTSVEASTFVLGDGCMFTSGDDCMLTLADGSIS